MKKLDKIFDTVFSVLVISLLFSKALPNLLLPILIVLFIVKEKNIKPKLILLSGSLIFSLYFLFSSIINNHFIEDKSIIIKILLIPLLMLLTLGVKNINQIKISFIFGVLVTNLIVLFKMVIYYYHFESIAFGNNETVNQILLIDRPYLGFANVISFIFIYVLMKDVKKKWILKILMIFIVSFLMIIVARLSIFTILILSLIFLVYKNNKSHSKKWTLYSIIIIACLVAIFKSNNSFTDRFYLKSTFKESYNHFLFQEPRVIIWSCALQIIKNEKFNILFGTDGFKQNQKNLSNCYEDKIINVSKKKYYISEKFNTHNQFLDFILTGGIIGLILFISLLVSIFYNSNRDIETMTILFSFMLFLLVENIIWRQWGIYFIGLLLPLILKKKI